MATVVSLSIYALNGSSFQTPRTLGIQTSLIKGVFPTRDGAKWIGTNKPSNYGQIYAQIEVAKDEAKTSTDIYYTATSVANVITAINA